MGDVASQFLSCPGDTLRQLHGLAFKNQAFADGTGFALYAAALRQGADASYLYNGKENLNES